MGSGSILLRSTSSPRTSNSMFGRSEGLEPAAFLARPRARLICCIKSTEGKREPRRIQRHPHAHQEPLPKSLFAFWPERTAPWKREPRRIQSTLAFIAEECPHFGCASYLDIVCRPGGQCVSAASAWVVAWALWDFLTSAIARSRCVIASSVWGLALAFSLAFASASDAAQNCRQEIDGLSIAVNGAIEISPAILDFHVSFIDAP